MITDEAILNRIAKTLSENFEKFGWASTLGDKFEVWFQIELCLGFFGTWGGLDNLFHTINKNLAREVTIDNATSYKGSKRDVDILIAADGLPIHDSTLTPDKWSTCVYAVELKAGIPTNKDDAHKDMCHALKPAQIAQRRGKFNDRGMSVFLLNAQDTTIKGLRSFSGQVQRIATIAGEQYPKWTLLRNSDYASPNFMVLALVPYATDGLALMHYDNGTLSKHPKLDELLSYQQVQIKGPGFVVVD
jgi:hypothetical protein